MVFQELSQGLLSYIIIGPSNYRRSEITACITTRSIKSAGAEAISINEQRLTAFSPLAYKEDRLYIRERALTAPLEIKAIGNPEILGSLLMVRYGLLDTMRKEAFFQVNVTKQEELAIPRYYGPIKIKHANVVG